MNGNERRAAARHAAWAAAAEALRHATLKAPPPGVQVDAKATALYWEQREAVQRYLDDRARGVLSPPPGGLRSTAYAKRQRRTFRTQETA